jgi:hypothetical protein
VSFFEKPLLWAAPVHPKYKRHKRGDQHPDDEAYDDQGA